MTTVVSIMMSDIVPLRQRGTWQGILNIVFASGAACGAPLGILNDPSTFLREYTLMTDKQVAYYRTLLDGDGERKVSSCLVLTNPSQGFPCTSSSLRCGFFCSCLGLKAAKD